MKSSVIIKGNKYGFQIVLNPTLPFEELLREVGTKFKESTHFFDLNKPIAVSFTGRELTSGEQNLLVDTISENSGLNISCVIDGAKVYETQFAKVLNEIREEEKKEKEIAEQKQRRQNKRDFVKLTGDLFDSTDKFVSNLSNISIKATHTWSNAIWKEKSKETNKWTLKKNGKFRDFSDAVNLCISDTVYSNKTAKQYEKFKETYSKWEKIKSDDYIYNEYKDICEDTENYCNAIHSLYSLLASPTGNYDDFSTSITNAENDIKIYAESLSSDMFKLYH